MPHPPHYAVFQRGGARHRNMHQKHLRGEQRPRLAHLQRGRQMITWQNPHQRGKAFLFKNTRSDRHIQLKCHSPSSSRKSIRRTMSGDLAGRTPNTLDPVPAEETGVDRGPAPDCPSAEGSEDMSVTNSEVENVMNHWCRRAVLPDPRFSKEAFSAFSLADAYIRAA